MTIERVLEIIQKEIDIQTEIKDRSSYDIAFAFGHSAHLLNELKQRILEEVK